MKPEQERIPKQLTHSDFEFLNKVLDFYKFECAPQGKARIAHSARITKLKEKLLEMRGRL